jgi:hypothetical protein
MVKLRDLYKVIGPAQAGMGDNTFLDSFVEWEIFATHIPSIIFFHK